MANQGLAENWGYPSKLYNYSTGEYEDGGMVWQGAAPCTKADTEALHNSANQDGDRDVDYRSTCGKDDPDWTTFTEVNQDKEPYTQSAVAG
jgi:hypothetical protein